MCDGAGATPYAEVDFAPERAFAPPAKATFISGGGDLMIQPWQLFLAVLVLLGMLAILAAFVILPDDTHQYYF
jgi:hypothetical protein